VTPWDEEKMQFLASIGTWGGWATGYYLVVPFLFVLTIVVFFHELGHFLVARWCGIRVEVFSIGFGRELLGFTDRRGTRWKISAIPLGGYVKFLGDENAASVPDRHAVERLSESDRRDCFYFKPLWQRAAVVSAGPIANFLLAIVIFAGIAMWYGKQETAPRVDEVIPNSAAAAAGFQPGDLVVSIDGRPIEDFSEMQRVVATNPGRPLEFGVERAGKTISLKATPTPTDEKGAFGGERHIGVLGVKRSLAAGDIKVQKVGPLAAIELGANQSWNIVAGTFQYLFRLASGRESASQIGGPAGIWLMSSEAARLGFDVLMRWAAAISVSIGLLNLFPIPLLDGGHLLFYGLEAVRGRPLSDRAQELGFRIGFAIVLMLMVFATYNDVWRVIDLVHKLLS
jgi:regulator of sigma E protease